MGLIWRNSSCLSWHNTKLFQSNLARVSNDATVDGSMDVSSGGLEYIWSFSDHQCAPLAWQVGQPCCACQTITVKAKVLACACSLGVLQGKQSFGALLIPACPSPITHGSALPRQRSPHHHQGGCSNNMRTHAFTAAPGAGHSRPAQPSPRPPPAACAGGLSTAPHTPRNQPPTCCHRTWNVQHHWEG